MLMIGFVLCVFSFMACSQAGPLPTSTTVATPTSVPVGQAAKDGDTVAVHYIGTLDSGEVFDSFLERQPLGFVLGSGQMISGFDAAVHGLKVGEAVTVRLEPEEAYGEPQDDLIIEFPIDQLPEGAAEGDSVMLQNGAQGVILEVTNERFKVDSNHRLAGQPLTFEIQLVSIQ